LTPRSRRTEAVRLRGVAYAAAGRLAAQ
jgi:hypothetical protein